MAKKLELKKEIWTLDRIFTCQSFKPMYMLEFPIERCKQQYIGMTGGQLTFCLDEHGGYIIIQVTNRATGAPWNLPRHSLADLKVTILEQTNTKDEEYRKERDKYFIRRFDTFNREINRKW